MVGHIIVTLDDEKKVSIEDLLDEIKRY